MNRERLFALMRRHNLTALVGTSPENIFYASGYMPFQNVWNRFAKAVVVLVDHAEPVLVLPVAELGFARDALKGVGAEVMVFGSSNFVVPNPTALDASENWIYERSLAPRRGIAEAVLEVAARAGVSGRIAVDRTGAPEVFDQLRVRAESREILDRGEDVWRLARMVKTPSEVVRLTRAARLNEDAIDAAIAGVGRMSEREIERTYSSFCHAGGGWMQHWTGGASARAGAFHGSDTSIAAYGSRFRFDCGLVLDGYCSDLGGTLQVGVTPSAAELATYRALTEGIDEGAAKLRPGMKTSTVYAMVLQAIRRAGLPEHSYSMCGHGIGVEPRDYPIITAPMALASPFWDTPFDPLIEVGMVLNIECPMNILGEGGYQHEVTMVVEESGARLLSKRREYDTVAV